MAGGTERRLNVALPLQLKQLRVFIGLNVDADDFVADFSANSSPCLEMLLQRSMATTAMGSVPAARAPGQCSRAHSHCVIVTPHKAKEHDQQRNKRSVIQAPSANFATSTTQTVMPVTKAPKPFTNALFSQ